MVPRFEGQFPDVEKMSVASQDKKVIPFLCCMLKMGNIENWEWHVDEVVYINIGRWYFLY